MAIHGYIITDTIIALSLNALYVMDIVTNLGHVNQIDIKKLGMENRELIYEMAKRLDMVIEVWKEGKYMGKFRFINGKLHKLKE